MMSVGCDKYVVASAEQTGDQTDDMQALSLLPRLDGTSLIGHALEAVSVHRLILVDRAVFHDDK